MSFGSFDEQTRPAPMAEINVTPMVDVMLVLLVIFILAAPLFTHAIRLDLPQATSPPAATLPQTVTLSIDAAGNLFWNEAPIVTDMLGPRMAEAARQLPAPDLQLRADRASRYEIIAQVMAAAQAAGLTKIGFVTEPQAPGGSAPVPNTPVTSMPLPTASAGLQISPALTAAGKH